MSQVRVFLGQVFSVFINDGFYDIPFKRAFLLSHDFC